MHTRGQSAKVHSCSNAAQKMYEWVHDSAEMLFARLSHMQGSEQAAGVFWLQAQTGNCWHFLAPEGRVRNYGHT